MIKTLKSELKLRPTYDEMIGMVESQGDPNRPSIEQVIDRKATLFRNNQFGSQFDNIDFLGLKKQEEDRAKDNLRQAQLRNAGIQQGTSTGLMSINTSAFQTPAEVYEDLLLRPEPTMQELEEFRNDFEEFRKQKKDEEKRALDIIRASMIGDTERYREQVRKQNFEISQMAKNDLSDVHGQVLPAGVPVYSTATDEEDDPELIPASEDEEEEMTEGERRRHRHKFMIDYSTKISKWQEKSVSADDIGFQLFLRGIELTDKQEQEMLRLKVRGDGKNPTRKDYLIGIVDDLIKSGKWTDEINDQLLLKRASDWHVKKHIGKGKENEEEEEELPALEQQVVFTTEFDPDKVLNDGNINYRGLMFQLHVRDLLTPETIELLNKIPTDQKKKQYLVSLIEGLKENDEWNADFNSEKLSRKN